MSGNSRYQSPAEDFCPLVGTLGTVNEQVVFGKLSGQGLILYWYTVYFMYTFT
jgi:hypothetical protein